MVLNFLLMPNFLLGQQILQFLDPLPQPHYFPIIFLFLTPIPAIKLPKILTINFLRYLADMRDVDIVPIPDGILHFLKPVVSHLDIHLIFLKELLQLNFQGFPPGNLFPELHEQIALHLSGIDVHVVMTMSLFMVFSDVIDHLHVLVVVPL